MSVYSTLRPRRSDGAFTLIELLVVVAIIALLISILLPSLSQARQVARTVKCSSNMKQFGMANQMYADGQDGWFVAIVDNTYSPWWNGGVWSHNNQYRDIMGMGSWPANPYGDPGITCPAAPSREIQAGHFPHTYAMNRGGLTSWPWAVHRPSLPHPSQKVQMEDANSYAVTAGQANPTHWEAYGDAPDHEGFPVHASYRHGGGINYQHFDGHVARYSQEDAYPPRPTAAHKVLLWINEDYPEPYMD